MDGYAGDEVLDFIWRVVDNGYEHDRNDVVEAVAHHLGFGRATDDVGNPTKSAINSPIRRGVLAADG